MRKALLEKIKESLFAVLPITGIVLIICLFLIKQISGWLVFSFVIGAIMLIIGLSLFNLGADASMMRMGEQVGHYVTKKKNIWLLIGVTIAIGIIITIAEPDLMVLAGQMDPPIPKIVMIITVALGVGIFLALALLRIILQIKLNTMLFILYAILFVIASIVSINSSEFIAVAFDSGGVTTGPMTVPFILALGLGVASARGDNASKDDSFGLVSFCSIGPIIMVLILGLIFKGAKAEATEVVVLHSFNDFTSFFGKELLAKIGEIAFAILPIIGCVIVFEIILLKDTKKNIIKIFIGILYTYVGLVIFLTGASVGFMPIASFLGKTIATTQFKYILIPLGMIMGFFVVMAEPAVHVLNKQVEEITSGAISQKVMLFSLAIGVAVSIGLSMARVIFDFSILYVIIPGYLIAICLMFFVPKIFTAIAFDSGGVASGPMTATFLLPLAQGACLAISPDKMLNNGFGVVALVAMTPLIVIQILGLIFKVKSIRMAKNIVLDFEPIIEFEIDYNEMEEKANE